MISLRGLECSISGIISKSRKEDKDIIEFLGSYGYRPNFNLDWYHNHRDECKEIYFCLNTDHIAWISGDDSLTKYYLEDIEEYNQKSSNLSIGDKVFIDTSKYPEIKGRIGVVKKISNYKGIITYRVDIDRCNNKRSIDGLYLFNKSQITRVETKTGKEATLTVCDDRGYDAKEFDALYNAKFDTDYMKERFKEGENGMKLLEIYKDRKMDKLFKDADKAQDKALEKNSTYKMLMELAEKTKTKDGYLFTFHFGSMPDSVREEIDKIQKDREEKESQLNILINEVNAQLSECETYEQKINVLKVYEILDEKGKVNA